MSCCFARWALTSQHISCISPQYPSPSLIQLGLSSRGYHSECIVTTLNRTVSVWFSPIPAVTQDIGKDTGRRNGGGDSHSPQVAEEVLVHPPASDGMQDSSQSLQAKGTLYHSDLKTFRLVAWKLSGRCSRVLAFQKRLLAQPLHVPGLHHGGSMMANGKPLLAGVLNRVSIPFM